LSSRGVRHERRDSILAFLLASFVVLASEFVDDSVMRLAMQPLAIRRCAKLQHGGCVSVAS